MADLEELFQINVKKLFERYTLPNKLIIKSNNDGEPMTCGELCTYMEIFSRLLKDGMEIDDVKSFIQV